MAIKRNTAANKNETERKEADGFLNLYITDKQGNVHKVQAIVPLYEGNRVHRALLGKGAGAEVTLTGIVNVVDKNPEEIEL